jgi:tyrosine-specific transport protein
MAKYIDAKFCGGVLLIAGTSIGAGMLALPVANAATGFVSSSLFLVLCWAFMLLGALLILEVNLYLAPHTNMVSMARTTLGLPGQVCAWVVYLALLYSLISAYISGGSDVLQGLITGLGIPIPAWGSKIVFTVMFGAIVIGGMRPVDYINRGLMFVKLSVYVLLVLMIAPKITINHLAGGEPRAIYGTVLVLVTSFGFASIVPSLRNYFAEDPLKIRLAMWIGSTIPLFCYIVWDAIIMGALPVSGTDSLLSLMHAERANTALIKALEHTMVNSWIDEIFWIFTSICMLTAFLAVSLGLTDFLADGLKISKQGRRGYVIYALTFGPPLFISVLVPGLFMKGLSYAGLFCVLLLVLLPVMMAWRGRYAKNLTGPYRVPGGKALLLVLALVSFCLMYLSFYQEF